MRDNTGGYCSTGEFAVGHQISRWRKLRGWSQRELARRAEIANGALSHIELGHSSPAVQTLQKLACALGVSLQALLFDEPRLPCEVIKADKAIPHKWESGGYCHYYRLEGDAGVFRIQLPDGETLNSQSLMALSGLGLLKGCAVHIYDGRCLFVVSGLDHDLSKGDVLRVAPAMAFEFTASGGMALDLVLSVI